MRKIILAVALLATFSTQAETQTIRATCPDGDQLTYVKTGDRNAITVNDEHFPRSAGTGAYVTRNGETATVQFAGSDDGYQIAVAMTPREVARGKIALIGWSTEPQECTIEENTHVSH